MILYGREENSTPLWIVVVYYICISKIYIPPDITLKECGQSKEVYLTDFTGMKILDRCGNDPSAGSPTETLLRLHLPLNDKV